MAHNLYIYLWNPDAAKFRGLPFNSKLYELERVVKRNLAHYKLLRGHGDGNLCILVAPDYLFEAPEEKEYHQSHKSLYDMALGSMRALLDEDMLLFGGSIRWIDYRTSALMVTTRVISRDRVELEYHKRFKAGTEDDVHTKFDVAVDKKQRTTLPVHARFQEGEVNGRFSFQNLTFGLEICQDHEKRTLYHTGDLVDVHVLLSYGQAARPDQVVARHGGVFIQCELVPGEHVVELNSQVSASKVLKSWVARVESKLFLARGMHVKHGQLKNRLQEVVPTPIDNISIQTSRCQLFVAKDV